MWEVILTEDTEVPVPIELKNALFERRRLNKRFKLDEESFLEFQRQTSGEINEIEEKLTHLNEELYEIADIFTNKICLKPNESDHSKLVREKANRKEYIELAKKRAVLIEKLDSAEQDYFEKCTNIQAVNERYKSMNVNQFDDDYVIKGDFQNISTTIPLLIQRIDNIEEDEIKARSSKELLLRLSIFFKSLFDQTK